MALKLRRRLEGFTNRRLPQQDGAASFKRLLGSDFTYATSSACVEAHAPEHWNQ